jgi:hypothetical protein
MKKYLFLLGIIVVSCSKRPIPVNQVIYGFNISNKTLFADGVTMDTVKVNLNSRADSNERTVLFTISGGNFLNSTGGADSVPAYYHNDTLTATTYFIAPLLPGVYYLTASPAGPNFNTMGTYVLMDTITVLPSVADSVILQTSNFGIASNFQGIITLKGILQNSLGNPVSLGTAVVFESYIPGNPPTPANGQFNLLNTLSDSSSSVNATFQVGNIAKGTVFDISVFVLDASGNPTNIGNTIPITVTQ